MTPASPPAADSYDHLGVDSPRTDSSGTVRLHVPASHAHLTIVRSTVAASVARQGVTVDDVDDLRLAAHEACALLIEDAVAHALISLALLVEGNTVRMRCTTPTRRTDPLPDDTLSWTVLSALVTSASNRIDIESSYSLLRIDIQHSVQIPD